MNSTDDNPDHVVPKTADAITPADIQRLITRDESRDSIAGIGADAMAIRSLESELEVWTAKGRHYTDQGHSIPKAVQVQIDAKQGSLDWQRRAYAQNKEQYGDLERRDARALNAEQDQSYAVLASTRETNMRTSVERVMRKEGISKFEAMTLIQQEIAVDGERAEQKYLPQYYSIRNRMLAERAQQPAPAAPAAAPEAAQPTPVQAQARREFASVKGRVDAAIAAGGKPNMNDMIRLDELSSYV